MKLNQDLVLERRGHKLKSNVQSYDIRDSEAYAGALEVEQLLRTDLAKESKSVDLAAAVFLKNYQR